MMFFEKLHEFYLIKSFKKAFKKYIKLVTLKSSIETFNIDNSSWPLMNFDLMLKQLPKLISEKGQFFDKDILNSLSKEELNERLIISKRVLESDGVSDDADEFYLKIAQDNIYFVIYLL